MMLRSRWVRLACLLIALGWSGASQAQGLFTLTGNSGGQLQIGTGLPLPVGTAGIFLGGQTPGDAGNFPPLLIPPVPGKGIVGTVGGGLQFPPAVLSRPAPGTPQPIAVFPSNPAVFQVATSIDYQWPAASATLAPGGGPGSTVLGTPGGGVAIYNAGPNAFGGAAQFAIAPGSGAGAARLGPSGNTGNLPIASVWINFAGGAPNTVMAVAVAGASAPDGLAQPGAPAASPAATTMFGAPSNGFGAVNVTTPVTCCTMGPAGTINGSIFPITVPFPTPGGGTVMLNGLANDVTASKGFPWTTGTITLSQPGASPPEVFFMSGTDMRVGGEGNISLVSGSLSLRALSGPNGNRGWLSLTLPEPTAAMGAVGALAMLGLCHGLVRRRSR